MQSLRSEVTAAMLSHKILTENGKVDKKLATEQSAAMLLSQSSAAKQKKVLKNRKWTKSQSWKKCYVATNCTFHNNCVVARLVKP